MPKGYTKLQNGSYAARMNINGVRKHLGCFKTAEEAHAAYLKAKARVEAGEKLSKRPVALAYELKVRDRRMDEIDETIAMLEETNDVLSQNVEDLTNKTAWLHRKFKALDRRVKELERKA